MLLMSAGDEVELERWRTQHGRCQLSGAKMRPQPTMAQALSKLPSILALVVKMRLKAGGWLGPVSLTAEEATDVLAATKMNVREMMGALLDVAAAMGRMPGEGNHIGAVLEAESGAIYLGSPFAWQGTGLKFSMHGVQAAVLNAWHQGESRLRSLMVETPPCACCRQFLRETWNWNNIKIYQAGDGSESGKTGAFTEIPFAMNGLKLEGIKSRLMGEPQRGITLGKFETNELINLAAEAASYAYAPYSKNFAGVALKTKRGTVHLGRYAECSSSIVGVLAIESALISVVASGGSLSDVAEVILVETRGTVTQFSATQKLVMAMDNIPFRFMMAT